MSSIYKVLFTKEAVKSFSKLTRKKQQQVKEIITKLSKNPFSVSNVKPLKGTKHDDYRIRIGTVRLIYRIENDQLVITVLHLGSRGDVYK